MDVVRLGVLMMCCVACGGRSTPVRIGHASPPPTSTATSADPSADTSTSAAGPAPSASIRLIHAALESRDAALSIVADGRSSPTVTNTGYEFASAYGETSSGDHAVSAQAGGAELIGASMTFASGPSTIVAFSTADFPVALALAPDARSVGAPEAAHVRVFHAVVGLGAIDVCVAPASGRADGAVLVSAIAAGSFGDGGGAYADAQGGAVLPLQLRARDSVPCHGRALGIARFTPAAGSNYTLIAVGRVRGRRVPIELIFCADPPATDTSCATVALEAH